MAPRQPLSSVLPPLIFGTATFNYQYNDPSTLAIEQLIHHALSLGVRAFDTSPYYGPSEELLGAALASPAIAAAFPRSSYFLLTKVGRISAHEFDYSAAWIRQSIKRSLARLHTTYLDVVYAHDVEFVSAAECLAAVTELRRLRDQGTIRYVGISGYPVGQLCGLAEHVLRATAEPLDALMSYANFTLQNTQLASAGLPRLRAARVDVVPNASILGMGLLRSAGVPAGATGDWHPAPPALRAKAAAVARFLEARGDRLEKIAIRFAVENWLREGADVGASGAPALGRPFHVADDEGRRKRLGVTVIGVSDVRELDETMRVWRSILDALDAGVGARYSVREEDDGPRRSKSASDREWGLLRRHQVNDDAGRSWKMFGDWYNFAWPSPDEAYLRLRMERAAVDGGQGEEEGDERREVVGGGDAAAC